MSHPDHAYRDQLAEVTFQPVFIMGDHRTGTTLLYQLLETTGHFNIVTVYHIACYHEIVHNAVVGRVAQRKQELIERFASFGLDDRGFDGVALGPDTPEEYGFILRGGGYRPQLRPDNLDCLIELAQKIQYTADSERILLLKNPWDYFCNFSYVKAAFPDSKFVFIQRDPIATINSQLRASRELFAQQNGYVATVVDWYAQIFAQPLRLSGMRLMFSRFANLGVRLSIRHVERATDYFVRQISQLPPGDFICLRYEDLCRQPQRVLHGVQDFLGLEPRRAGDRVASIQVRQGLLLPELKPYSNAIYRRTWRYCKTFGYGPAI